MSWVDIKQGEKILRVPFQAFKDVFERNGFELISTQHNLEPSKEVQKPKPQTIKKESKYVKHVQRPSNSTTKKQV